MTMAVSLQDENCAALYTHVRKVDKTLEAIPAFRRHHCQEQHENRCQQCWIR
jgi:hypothetical protein